MTRACLFGTLSAVLFGYGYIPSPAWLSLICLAPLWVFWQHEKNTLNIVISGFAFSIVASIIRMDWVLEGLSYYNNHDPYFNYFYFLIFSLINHIAVVFSGLCWGLLLRHSRLGFWLLPIYYQVFIDLFYVLVPWNFGYPWLYQLWPGFQLAEFIGFWGLSLITLYLNLLAAKFLLSAISHKSIYAPAFSFGLIFVMLNSLGLLTTFRNSDAPDHINVGLIQGRAASNYVKSKTNAKATHAYYAEQSRLLLQQTPRPDVIVWGEATIKSLYQPEYAHLPVNQLMRKTLHSLKVPIIAGTLTWNEQTEKFFNTAMLFDEKGEIETQYNKRNLFPFTEYSVLSSFIDSNWARSLSLFNVERGVRASIFSLNNIPALPLVCYEVIFPEIHRDLTESKARLIVTISNESWAQGNQVSIQHNLHASARAIELRVPVVRVSHGGVSSVTTASGKTLVVSDPGKEWTKSAKVPVPSVYKETFFASHAYLTADLAKLLVLLNMIYLIIKKVQYRRRERIH